MDSEALGLLFDNAVSNNDFTVLVGTTRIPFAKAMILTRGSQRLKELFGNLETSEYIETLTDNVDAVRIALKYVYSHSTHAALSLVNVIDVLRIAKKYGLENLLHEGYTFLMKLDITHDVQSLFVSLWKDYTCNELSGTDNIAIGALEVIGLRIWQKLKDIDLQWCDKLPEASVKYLFMLNLNHIQGNVTKSGVIIAMPAGSTDEQKKKFGIIIRTLTLKQKVRLSKNDFDGEARENDNVYHFYNSVRNAHKKGIHKEFQALLFDNFPRLFKSQDKIMVLSSKSDAEKRKIEETEDCLYVKRQKTE